MKQLAIGLMSGTSLDGLSIALCRFNQKTFDLLHYKTYPYPEVLTKKISRGLNLKTPELSQLNTELGHFYANRLVQFLKKHRISSKKICVIGSHGQTIYHGIGDRFKNTLQIGEPSFLAEQTGIPVVADFRVRDIAAGGEGAPLIPYFDQYFFGQGSCRALQNIGGIANVTVVGKSNPLLAFDTGPGNCLIDWAIQRATRNKLKFDRNGEIARKGSINHAVIRQMMAHPYFKKRPPKSTGRELFNEKFIPSSLLKEKTSDLIATLTYFTAYSIYQSYQTFIPQKISEIIVSGGGALNKTLMNHLKELFHPVPVTSIEKFGIPAQAKEPVAFAFFALQALNGKINHLPQGTGAKSARILGKIIPGNLHAAA